MFGGDWGDTDAEQRATALKLAQAMGHALTAAGGTRPLCPADGLPGAYQKVLVSFPLVALVYQCPNGHAFTYEAELEGSEYGTAKLLPHPPAAPEPAEPGS